MSERYSRNEALFGKEGQEKLGATRVVIAGLGGLGAQVAQQLAYLGVRHFGLIDFDVVTASSLNRLVGATHADIYAAAKKILVAKRMIEAINPEALVSVADDRVDSPGAACMVGNTDVMFGCLDHERARLSLTELCCRHAKPYFDLASDVNMEGGYWGGRMLLCDGARCLVCMGMLDQEEMRLEAMAPAEAHADERLYGVRRAVLGDGGPSVVSINATVASVAVTEFMVLVTGLRPPIPYLVYRGDTQTLRSNRDAPAPDCYYCKGLWGKG